MFILVSCCLSEALLSWLCSVSRDPVTSCVRVSWFTSWTPLYTWLLHSDVITHTAAVYTSILLSLISLCFLISPFPLLWFTQSHTHTPVMNNLLTSDQFEPSQPSPVSLSPEQDCLCCAQAPGVSLPVCVKVGCRSPHVLWCAVHHMLSLSVI